MRHVRQLIENSISGGIATNDETDVTLRVQRLSLTDGVFASNIANSQRCQLASHDFPVKLCAVSRLQLESTLTVAVRAAADKPVNANEDAEPNEIPVWDHSTDCARETETNSATSRINLNGDIKFMGPDRNIDWRRSSLSLIRATEGGATAYEACNEEGLKLKGGHLHVASVIYESLTSEVARCIAKANAYTEHAGKSTAICSREKMH